MEYQWKISRNSKINFLLINALQPKTVFLPDYFFYTERNENIKFLLTIQF